MLCVHSQVYMYFIPLPSVQFGTKSSKSSCGSWRWKGVSGSPGTNQGTAPSENSPTETWSISSRSTTPWSGEYDTLAPLLGKLHLRSQVNVLSISGV